MNLKVLNIEGNKSKDINVSDKLTGLKVNNRLLKYVIDWQLNHSKKRVAKTKQRNEVVGSTKKIYAQKGTGGARHASRKAPLFVGGGVAHGPKGDNYKTKKINKKIRKIALAQTISKKRNNNELFIFDDVKKEIKKTKIFYSFLNKNKIDNVLIVSDKITEKNIKTILKKYDIICDGTDNFDTRLLINDYCKKNKKILISAAISKFDGHLFKFNFKKKTPCFRCFMPQRPIQEMNCDVEGIFPPVAGILGSLQANEVLKTILDLKDDLNGNMLIFDSLKMNIRKSKIQINPNCKNICRN